MNILAVNRYLFFTNNDCQNVLLHTGSHLISHCITYAKQMLHSLHKILNGHCYFIGSDSLLIFLLNPMKKYNYRKNNNTVQYLAVCNTLKQYFFGHAVTLFKIHNTSIQGPYKYAKATCISLVCLQ